MPGIADSKANDDKLAPVSPLVQAPDTIITSPVIEQIIIVSINVPIMAIVPCLTGLFVIADAWAIGALPKPASFEKIPRATPNRMAAQTAAPAKPPVAAIGVNA